MYQVNGEYCGMLNKLRLKCMITMCNLKPIGDNSRNS